MVDEETGIDPKAKDGEPDRDAAAAQREADQLAMKRARKAEEEAQAARRSDADAERAMGGRPIDDQPPEPEPTEQEVFPQGVIDGDHKVTIKNIVPAGKSRKTEAKMRATAIPLRDGLVRYGDLVELLVTVEAGEVKEVPDLEEPEAGGRRILMGVKDVQSFRPVHVRSAASTYTLEQVLDILTQFGIPRTADRVVEMFGLAQPAAAAG